MATTTYEHVLQEAVHLTPEERAVAPRLFLALSEGRAAIEDEGIYDPAAVTARMRAVIEAEPRFTLDYAEAVDAADLTTPTRLSGAVRLLVAARLGRARLIDNLAAFAPEGGPIRTGATAP